MSKYNLIDIYEGMSDEEFNAAEEAGRLEKHPEKDKIQKIKDLMSKEKSIEESNKEEQLKNAYAALDKAEQDGDIRKQELALAAIDLIKGDLKENNIEEMTGEIYNRIDSLIDQNLKMEFIDKFIAIQDDLIEDDENFDSMDLIDYLANELQKFGEDARMFEGARPGYNADGSPKSNDEMSDDEREAFYNDSGFIDEDESLKEHFGRFMKDYQ